jgi:iron complex transport system permease protein
VRPANALKTWLGREAAFVVQQSMTTATAAVFRAASSRGRLSLPAAMAIGVTLLLAALILGIMLGPTTLGADTVIRTLWEQALGLEPSDPVAHSIIWQIRLPRVLLAAVVGAALTTSGTVLQALVRNPLADPFILGISAGASVGATAVLLFGAFAALGLWALSVGSVAGALVAMAIVFLVALEAGQLTPTRLILCGVALSAVFSAISSFLLFEASPQAAQAVMFWLLGSFARASWEQLWLPSLSLAGAVIYLLSHARGLNAISVGAETATSVGVGVQRLRRSVYFVTSLIAGVSVAVSGIIGFVGLVIPHILRLSVGNDHRVTLPVGLFWGAGFMVIADLLARVVVTPQELPIGVITALIGGPIFVFLIRQRAYRYGVGA